MDVELDAREPLHTNYIVGNHAIQVQGAEPLTTGSVLFRLRVPRTRISINVAIVQDGPNARLYWDGALIESSEIDSVLTVPHAVDETTIRAIADSGAPAFAASKVYHFNTKSEGAK